jgi:ornithine cyclodeaminase/alanine dehydrogenase-like protein (mu-crystallin family)
VDADLTLSLEIPVEATATGEAAYGSADIIVTAAREPILKAEWLAPGQHVTAMGADSEHKIEIDPAAFAKIVYIADSLTPTRRHGEFAHAIKAGSVTWLQ